jgi:hypothetical protein
VWVPLTEEAETVQRLLQRGWAVSPGERFRFDSAPGIRITAATLKPAEAADLASALNDIINPATATYAG